MTPSESILILGGLLNLLISAIGAYFLFWQRIRDPSVPAQRYGLRLHKGSLWNGFLLLGLSIAIVHTNFTPGVNQGIAIAEVIATLLSNGRAIQNWIGAKEDEFATGTEFSRRLVGVANLIHLVALSAIFYGVGRTALGL